MDGLLHAEVVAQYQNGLKEIEVLEEKRSKAFQDVGSFTLYKFKHGQASMRDIPNFAIIGKEEEIKFNEAMARLADLETELEQMVKTVNSYAEQCGEEILIYRKIDLKSF